jgi:hypothetical protein
MKVSLNFMLFTLIIIQLKVLNSKSINYTKYENLSENYNDYDDLAPSVQSRSSPTPMPQVYKITNKEYYLDKLNFEFELKKNSAICNVTSDAINRYYNIIFNPQALDLNKNIKLKRFLKNKRANDKEKKILEKLIIDIEICEEVPTLESDESCI